MKVLIVSTDRADLRSEIWGWTSEDSSKYVPNKPIGLTPGPSYDKDIWRPNTILEALAYGWKLLAPPKEYELGTEEEYPNNIAFEWWLTKD